jgi:NAD+ kinase
MAIDETPHILVAYKKSRWEHYADSDDGTAPILQRATDEEREELQEAHRVHRRAVKRVCDHLADRGFDVDEMYRGEVEQTDPYDLVVAVGGDGTVLDLSHRITDLPILAVNSHPQSSVGYFCAGVVDKFPQLLDGTLDGSLGDHALARFYVDVDGERVSPPVLNDVLISHANPAAVSRYVVTADGRDPETQRSSGIWVATPAGSTAAIRSAGGYVLPLGCRSIEYLVREPYPVPDHPYRVTKGVQPLSNPFEVRSEMQEGRIFIDGPHIDHEFGFGATLRIDGDAPPLRIFGLDVARRTD